MFEEEEVDEFGNPITPEASQPVEVPQPELTPEQEVEQHNIIQQSSADYISSLTGIPSAAVAPVASFIKGAADIIGGISKVPGQLKFTLGEAFNPELAQQMKENPEVRKAVYDAAVSEYALPTDQLSEDMDALTVQDVDGGITANLMKGDYADAGQQMVQQVAGAVPSVLATMTGPGGLAAIGLSSLGNNYEETMDEHPGESSMKILGTSLVKAGGEVASEYVTQRIGMAALKALRGGASAEAVKAGLGPAVKRIFSGFNNEGLSEAAAEMLNHGVDNLAYGEEFGTPEMWKGLADSYIVGGIMGGGMSSIGEANTYRRNSVLDGVPSKSNREYQVEREAAINALSNESKNITDPAELEANEKAIAELEGELANNLDQQHKVWDNMSQEETMSYLQLKKDAEGFMKAAENAETQEAAQILQAKADQKIQEADKLYETVENWDGLKTEADRIEAANRAAEIANPEAVQDHVYGLRPTSLDAKVRQAARKNQKDYELSVEASKTKLEDKLKALEKDAEVKAKDLSEESDATVSVGSQEGAQFRGRLNYFKEAKNEARYAETLKDIDNAYEKLNKVVKEGDGVIRETEGDIDQTLNVPIIDRLSGEVLERVERVMTPEKMAENDQFRKDMEKRFKESEQRAKEQKEKDAKALNSVRKRLKSQAKADETRAKLDLDNKNDVAAIQEMQNEGRLPNEEAAAAIANSKAGQNLMKRNKTLIDWATRQAWNWYHPFKTQEEKAGTEAARELGKFRGTEGLTYDGVRDLIQQEALKNVLTFDPKSTAAASTHIFGTNKLVQKFKQQANLEGKSKPAVGRGKSVVYNRQAIADLKESVKELKAQRDAEKGNRIGISDTYIDDTIKAYENEIYALENVMPYTNDVDNAFYTEEGDRIPLQNEAEEAATTFAESFEEVDATLGINPKESARMLQLVADTIDGGGLPDLRTLIDDAKIDVANTGNVQADYDVGAREGKALDVANIEYANAIRKANPELKKLLNSYLDPMFKTGETIQDHAVEIFSLMPRTVIGKNSTFANGLFNNVRSSKQAAALPWADIFEGTTSKNAGKKKQTQRLKDLVANTVIDSMVDAVQQINPDIELSVDPQAMAKFRKTQARAQALANKKSVRPIANWMNSMMKQTGQRVIINDNAVDQVNATIPHGTVNGFINKNTGDIYVRSTVGPETVIHEMGHAWAATAKAFRPELYAQGVKLSQQSVYVNRVRANYPGLESQSKARFEEEVLAHAIEDKGKAITDKYARNKFEQWVDKFFKAVMDAIGIKAKKNPADLTYDEFMTLAATEILNGKGLANASQRADHVYGKIDKLYKEGKTKEAEALEDTAEFSASKYDDLIESNLQDYLSGDEIQQDIEDLMESEGISREEAFDSITDNFGSQAVDQAVEFIEHIREYTDIDLANITSDEINDLMLGEGDVGSFLDIVGGAPTQAELNLAMDIAEDIFKTGNTELSFQEDMEAANRDRALQGLDPKYPMQKVKDASGRVINFRASKEQAAIIKRMLGGIELSVQGPKITDMIAMNPDVAKELKNPTWYEVATGKQTATEQEAFDAARSIIDVANYLPAGAREVWMKQMSKKGTDTKAMKALNNIGKSLDTENAVGLFGNDVDWSMVGKPTNGNINRIKNNENAVRSFFQAINEVAESGRMSSTSMRSIKLMMNNGMDGLMRDIAQPKYFHKTADLKKSAQSGFVREHVMPASQFFDEAFEAANDNTAWKELMDGYDIVVMPKEMAAKIDKFAKTALPTAVRDKQFKIGNLPKVYSRYFNGENAINPVKYVTPEGTTMAQEMGIGPEGRAELLKWGAEGVEFSIDTNANNNNSNNAEAANKLRARKIKRIENALNLKGKSTYKSTSPYKQSKVTPETRQILDKFKREFAQNKTWMNDKQLDQALENINQIVKNGTNDQKKIREAYKQQSEARKTSAAQLIKEAEGIDPETISPVEADAIAKKKSSWLNRISIAPDANNDFYGLLYNLFGKKQQNREWFENELTRPLEYANLSYIKDKQEMLASFNSITKPVKGLTKKSGVKIKGHEITNDQAVRIFNHIKNPHLWKQMNDGGIDAAKMEEIVDYVNSRPDLKTYSNQITDIYAKFLTKLNPEMAKHGYKTIGDIGMPVDQSNINMLEKIFGKNNIPETAPYTPFTAQGTEDYVTLDNLSSEGGDYYSVMSGNLKRRVGGGKYTFASNSNASDFKRYLSGPVRTKNYLDFAKNASDIFSSKNLKAMDAAYGKEWGISMRDSLKRIVTGQSGARQGSAERSIQKFFNGTVAGIMFLNMRSAALQLISTGNYLVEHPATFIKGLGKGYFKAFQTIVNSNWMKERGSGRTDLETQELFDSDTKNPFVKALNWTLEKGYALTKLGDRAAIALGGAAYINGQIKNGIHPGEAFRKFVSQTEETQQSTRQERLGRQQTSTLGRAMLSFANTPMQYNRKSWKAIKDIRAGKNIPGNMGRVAYYLAAQNALFTASQQMLFGALDLEDDDERDKVLGGANSMLDTVLRGSGIYGALASTLKNIAMAKMKGDGRNDTEKVYEAVMNTIPGFGQKMRQLKNTFKKPYYSQSESDLGGTELYPDVTVSQVANGVSFLTNAPVWRALSKAEAVADAFADDLETWQKVMRQFGYNRWTIGATGDDSFNFDFDFGDDLDFDFDFESPFKASRGARKAAQNEATKAAHAQARADRSAEWDRQRAEENVTVGDIALSAAGAIPAAGALAGAGRIGKAVAKGAAAIGKGNKYVGHAVDAAGALGVGEGGGDGSSVGGGAKAKAKNFAAKKGLEALGIGAKEAASAASKALGVVGIAAAGYETAQKFNQYQRQEMSDEQYENYKRTGSTSGSRRGANSRGRRSPINKLGKGEMGQAHRDGTIEVDPNLSPVDKAKTIAHEKKHVEDMQKNGLDYDDHNVYFKGKKFARKNGMIKYDGKWKKEGDENLPWEKRAYAAEKNASPLKNTGKNVEAQRKRHQEAQEWTDQYGQGSERARELKAKYGFDPKTPYWQPQEGGGQKIMGIGQISDLPEGGGTSEGADWVEQWEQNPETLARYKAAYPDLSEDEIFERITRGIHTPTQEFGDGGKASRGLYVPEDQQIFTGDQGRTDIEVHERTHASGLDAYRGSHAKDILGHLPIKDSFGNVSSETTEYVNSPQEVGAYMQQLRYDAGLKPGQKLTEDQVKKLVDKYGKDNMLLKGVKQNKKFKEFTKALNEVASSEPKIKKRPSIDDLYSNNNDKYYT